MALQNSDLLPLYRVTDASNRKITVAGLTSFIQAEAGKLAKPGREGTFVIVEDADGNITYDDYTEIDAIDGGEYAT